MNLNRAMIIGNLTRDVELRTLPTGQTVANFAIATSTKWKAADGQMQERTEFHNIQAWGKLAEICGQYLAKGRKAYVEGRLQTREWEAADGSKKQRTEIVCENMILLDKPPSGTYAPFNASGSTSAVSVTGTPVTNTPTYSAPVSTPSTPKVDQGMGDNEIRIEDIPF